MPHGGTPVYPHFWTAPRRQNSYGAAVWFCEFIYWRFLGTQYNTSATSVDHQE